jgi:hypothetical protein
MLPKAPLPLVVQATLRILAHLTTLLPSAQPHESLSPPLLQELLDLLAHVQLTDEWIDKELDRVVELLGGDGIEGMRGVEDLVLTEEKRKTKRRAYFALGSMLKCSVSLADLSGLVTLINLLKVFHSTLPHTSPTTPPLIAPPRPNQGIQNYPSS